MHFKVGTGIGSVSTTSCDICGGPCTGNPITDNPTFEQEFQKLPNERYVTTEQPIIDPDLEVVVYGVGDAVPYADAVKYGLIQDGDYVPTAAEEEGEQVSPKRARRREATTARKHENDRAMKLEEDR